MESYTLLKLNDTSLEQAATLLETVYDLTPGEPWPENEKIYAKWNFVFRDPIISVTIANNQLPTLVADAVVQRPKREWMDSEGNPYPFEKRINEFNARAIFFKNGPVHYVALEGTFKSQKVCRVKSDLLIQHGLITDRPGTRMELLALPPEYSLRSEFFYWLCYCYIVCDGNIPCRDTTLRILEMSGYTGTSLAETQRVAGKGDRITQLLPTLAFLFTNDELNSLRLTLKIDDNKLDFEMDKYGGIKVMDYAGDLFRQMSFEEQEVSKVLWIYIYVIPLLSTCFADAKTSRTWGDEVFGSFVETIGRAIVRRIVSKVPSAIYGLGESAATNEGIIE